MNAANAESWMKQRYAAVCWDFYRYHQMQMPSDVHDTYCQALIDTIEGDYESHPVCTVVHIRRVFSLSNNNNLPAVKSTIRNFVIRHGQDDMAPGLWGVELDLIIANRKKFTEQEKAVVLIHISLIVSEMRCLFIYLLTVYKGTDNCESLLLLTCTFRIKILLLATTVLDQHCAECLLYS